MNSIHIPAEVVHPLRRAVYDRLQTDAEALSFDANKAYRVSAVPETIEQHRDDTLEGLRLLDALGWDLTDVPADTTSAVPNAGHFRNVLNDEAEGIAEAQSLTADQDVLKDWIPDALEAIEAGAAV